MLAVDRNVDRGHPPGLPHVAERRPDAHGHLQRVAGIRGHRRRADERSARERAHKFGIPLEAAGRHHDAASRRDLDRPVDGLEPHSADPPVVEDRSTARMPVRGSMPRSRHPLSNGPISPCPAPRSSWTLRRSSSAGCDPGRRAAAEAGLAHHDVARQLRTDGDACLPWPELVEGEQRALHRPAAARLRARVLGVVVGEVLDDLEPDGGVLLEIADRPPARHRSWRRPGRGRSARWTASRGRSSPPRECLRCRVRPCADSSGSTPSRRTTHSSRRRCRPSRTVRRWPLRRPRGWLP